MVINGDQRHHALIERKLQEAIKDANMTPVPRRQAEKPQNAKQASGGDRRYWSGELTRHSNALDLEPAVFTWDDPVRIARSLKRSAEESTRRKGTPYQSAMSMLTFYINRAGASLPNQRRQVLEQAKIKLRRLFGRS